MHFMADKQYHNKLNILYSNCTEWREMYNEIQMMLKVENIQKHFYQFTLKYFNCFHVNGRFSFLIHSEKN